MFHANADVCLDGDGRGRHARLVCLAFDADLSVRPDRKERITMLCAGPRADRFGDADEGAREKALAECGFNGRSSSRRSTIERLEAAGLDRTSCTV